MPKLKFCDVSGVRFLLPPNNPSPCVLQVAAVNGALGVPTQSGLPVPMVPLLEAARKLGEYKLYSVGARKPVEADPRSVTHSNALYFTISLPLLVRPKSLYRSSRSCTSTSS